jgi:transcriptional regulator with XRE-family HTH domain
MSTFSGELCRLLAERGMSQRELARRANYDCGFVNKLCRGTRPATSAVARRLDEVLDAGGALMALVSRREVLAGAAAAVAVPGTLDADKRDRLAWARRHPRAVDQAAVDSLAGVLAAQRRAEDALGSAAMVGPVTAQLIAIEDLVTGARGPIRPAVLDVAMQWSEFAAWLHTSVRDFPAARIMWRQTLELAVEADSVTMTATVLRFRAYMAWLAVQPGPLIGLAQAAQRDRRAAVSQRAFSASLEARGHAMAGDAQATERKLGEAAELGTRLGQRLDEPWSYWYAPGWLECQRGIALSYLAHIEHYRTQAIEALASPETVDSATELTAGYLVHRASVHMRGGDISEACADALQAVPVARQTESASLRGMLTGLQAGMAVRWPGDPRVTELADALR